MSWGPRRRRWWQRLALRGLALVGLLAITATLAMALQVRRVEVQGTHRFAATQVHDVLRAALGSPALTARPEALRDAVRALAWVADARVKISLDGIVSCTVTERVPVARALDGGRLALVDGEGRILGPATGAEALPMLEGYGAYPDERMVLVARIAALTSHWGAPLERALRLGPRDALLVFPGTAVTVVADPGRPETVADGRRVLAAWIAAHEVAPLRLDVRVPGRVAVLPAPPPTPESVEES